MDSPPLALDRILGVGRTGRVWRARVTAPWISGMGPGRLLAVKVLHTELLRDGAARAALAAEVEVGRAVRHSALVQFVYAAPSSPPPLAEALEESVALQRPAPEAPWLAMGLVPGPSLEDELRAAGPLPEPTLRAVGGRLAGALAALHAAGWTHGDVKPENARLDALGEAVLLDLGFARRVGSSTAPVGTIAYLAPERSLGGAPSPAADVYSLGATLHRLATGQHVVTDRENASDAAARALMVVPPPSNLVPRLSPLLDDVLVACLAPQPFSRPTAQELARIFKEGESSAWWRERVSFGAEARRDTAAWSGVHQLPLVGRSAELERLHVLWYLTRAGSGRGVWLEGERGSGKSRLVAELAHRMRRSDVAPPLYLYGRCGELEDERPAAAILALLHRWLHLPREASPGPREADLVHGLVPNAEARTLLDALSGAQRTQGETAVTEVAALATWLLRLARSTPVIVFLDDVDLAGKATLDVIARVARGLGETKLLLLLGVRGDTPPRHRAGFEALRLRFEGAERLTLGPLDEAAVQDLVDEVFHHSVPRRSLAKVLLGRTGGNPGRIGELLRLARAKGWTRPAPDGSGMLELCIAPSGLPRPASLARAVEARREALPAQSRIWLDRFAVLGGRLAPAVVARAFPRAVHSAQQALFALTAAGWLVSAGDRFRFARPNERDEVKRNIEPRRRHRYHAAAAEAYAGAAPASEDAYRRARHLRDANRPEPLLEMLGPLLAHAREVGHPRRRATLTGWGLEALDELPATPERIQLRRAFLEELADAADRLGEREEQRIVLGALGDLAGDADSHAAGRLYTLHARAAVATGESGLARGFARNAIELLQNSGESALADLATALLLAGRIEADAGDLEGAIERLRRAAAVAPTPAQRAEVATALAEVAALEDRLEDGLAIIDGALAEIAPAPDTVRTRAIRARVHLVQGRILRLVGRSRLAFVALARAARLADQAGEVRLAVEILARRGRLLLDLDKEEEAELELREALLLARTVEDRRGEALVTLFLGTLLAEREESLPDRSEAHTTLGRAASLSRELGLARVEALASAILARIERQAGRVDVALQLVEHAAQLVARFDAELLDRIVVEGTHALMLREAGQRREARRLVRTLTQRVTRENRAIADRLLRRRHRVAMGALVRSALSPEGPLYPRIQLSGLGADLDPDSVAEPSV